MKTITYLVACIFAALYSAAGADIDARLLRFTGELPAADLIRLTKSESMPALRSFSAALNADSSFSYQTVTPVAYPTEYDSSGKWLSTEDRDIGILFTGHAKPSDKSYALDFEFRFVEFTGTGVYRTDTDTVVRPIFQSHELKSKVVLQLGEWTLVTLPDDRESHLALLVRIRK